MTTLIVDRRDARLRLEGAALRVETGSEAFTAPLGPIERIILRGAMTVETGLLSRLWRQGIGLLVLSGRRGEPTARFHGQPHNDVSRRIAQVLAATDTGRAVAFARTCVSAKLEAQSRTLDQLAELRPGMRKGRIDFAEAVASAPETLARSATLDQLRGVEGAAARSYWLALRNAFAPSLGFAGRNRRPPRDPVNTALSLTYTIATFEAGARAQAVGLDPMVGFLHSPAFGRESLACDLIEPLRPKLDLWVESLFRTRRLRVEHFSTDPDGACIMGKAGRASFYEDLGEAMPAWSRWLSRAARRVCQDLQRGPEAPELPREPSAEGFSS